jgi:hypothetical protein
VLPHATRGPFDVEDHRSVHDPVQNCPGDNWIPNTSPQAVEEHTRPFSVDGQVATSSTTNTDGAMKARSLVAKLLPFGLKKY